MYMDFHSWSISLHRNNPIMFINCVIDVDELFYLAQVRIWTWIINKIPKTKFLYFDWILCPQICPQSIYKIVVYLDTCNFLTYYFGIEIFFFFYILQVSILNFNHKYKMR